MVKQKIQKNCGERFFPFFSYEIFFLILFYAILLNNNSGNQTFVVKSFLV